MFVFYCDVCIGWVLYGVEVVVLEGLVYVVVCELCVDIDFLCDVG